MAQGSGFHAQDPSRPTGSRATLPGRVAFRGPPRRLAWNDVRLLLPSLVLLLPLVACASKPAKAKPDPVLGGGTPAVSQAVPAAEPAETVRDPARDAGSEVPVAPPSDPPLDPLPEPSPPTRTAASFVEQSSLLERADAYPEAIATYDELFLTHASFAGREDAIKRRATLLVFVDLAKRSYVRALEAETVEEEIVHLHLIQSFWPGYENIGIRLREAKAGNRLPRSPPSEEDDG